MQKVSAKSSSAVWAHKKALRVSTPPSILAQSPSGK